DDERASSRLVREARNVATLRSKHVAQVLDVGVHEGATYLVMEQLEGRTLRDIVEKDGPFSIENAVDCIIQACHALADAHQHAIVNRDIKPSNLFLTTDEKGRGCIKVIDFGISKQAPLGVDDATGSTADGALLGSPAFMSPEQIRSSSDVDLRTDI